MLALRSKSPGLELADVSVPNRSGEALVRVLRSGICATDIQITKGYAGFSGTLGHEFVGVVEGGDVSADLIGKRVVGEINVGCGSCHLCVAGDARHCATRTVLGIKDRDGAHAEFLTLPERCLKPVPDSISNDAAVFIEPLAAACGILERAAVSPSDRVAVIGDGKLGLLCSFALALAVPQVTLIGKHASKLNLADRRGVNTLKADDAAGLENSFDIVIEASGAESGFASALDLVRPRGTLVLKSTFAGTPQWEAWRVVVDEITIVGSRCGLFEPAIDLLASGSVTVDDLISDVFPLADGLAGFDAAAQKGAMKILLKPNG
jgi:threonine dehydrogenase-like Zn-dependent dehydrogenase